MRILLFRHMLLVFKDRINFLLSFASAFVILALYFLFIRDFMLEAVENYGIASSYNRQFIDSLMLSGLVIVVGATASLGTVAVYIRDKETGISRDFLVSPLWRGKIFASYLAAGTVFSLLMMGLVFFVSLFFLKNLYGTEYQGRELALCGGVLLLSAVLSNFLLFAIALFLKTGASFSSFGNLYGVVIGFLTGVYIPIGYYPQAIQNLTAFFPMAQTTSLMRQILTEPALEKMKGEFPAQAVDVIEEVFGVRLEIFSGSEQVLFLIACGGLFLIWFFCVFKIKNSIDF